MAVVNYSVPDEVKESFDRTFGDSNKSAIIADLMRKAVRDHEITKRRRMLVEELSKMPRPPVSPAALSLARKSGRR